MVLVLLVGIGGSAVAAAAPDPACPASLRAVPGGTHDVEASGRDDGEAGPGADYEPGHVLVQLKPGVPPAAFDCVLRELDAGLIDGGRGKAGLGGLPGLMLVQLGPGKSVRKTVRLLNSRAYRDLIAFAEADDHLRPMDPPDDPLWNRQWGFDVASGVPARPQGDERDQPADQVQLDARRPALPESMRLTQAWEMTAQRKARWFRRAVQVAFIDDSLFQHEDLVQNTSTTQSRIQVPEGFNEQELRLRPRARGPLYVNTGAGGSVSCAVPTDATPQVIASLLGRRVSMLCDRTGKDVHAVVLTIGGDTGTVVLNDGQNGAARINVEEMWKDPAGARPEDFTVNRIFQFTKQLRAERNLFQGLPYGSGLAVSMLEFDDECRVTESSSCLRFVIVYDSPDLRPTLNRNDTRVTQETFVNGRPYYVPAPVALDDAAATVETARTVEKGRIIHVKWTGPDLTGLVTEWKDTSLVMPPADMVEKVTAYGEYIPQRNDATPQWPGGAPGHSYHGQAVAGLLAATANNAIGIAGVPGPNIKLKVTGIATPLTSSAVITAIEYATQVVKAKVVNLSIGNSYDDDEVPPDVVDTSTEDPRRATGVQRAMAMHRDTLFVLAAGNEATDHRRPALRHANQYRDQGASKGHCSPKGMGRTEWWNASGMSGGLSDKGGALSKLRMPDGTFDRGNILCVAAMAAPPQARQGDPPVRRLADFTSWGRDFVDVAAPGEDIVTTGANNQYRVVSGTSFAAPIVAGVAAMVIWMNPGIDSSRVKCAILSSATSAPLDPIDSNAMPFDRHPDFLDPPLTVNGMVVASEAISAAAALNGRRGRSRGGAGGGVFTDYKEPRAHCVQRRANREWNAQTRRWDTSGAWVNATRDDLRELSTAPPPAPPPAPPAPAQNERP